MEKSGFIAIIGRPNAGKSTLLNRVLQSSLSIVTPKAQTTRDRLLGILTEKKKGQIVFIDTPGIHRAREGGINQYMVSEAKGALEAPDLVWYLVDPRSALSHEEAVLEILKGISAPLFLLLNKSDLSKQSTDLLVSQLIKRFEELQIPFKKAFHISGLKGKGVPELLSDSWAILPEGPPFYSDPDQISDRPTRFFVAEKIREQLYLRLGDELPYSCAIEIEKFDENSKPPRIEAMIYVERESQKGMVVGKGGAKIKEIGQAARSEIEKFLFQPDHPQEHPQAQSPSKIFLGLRVKVLKDWSRNAETLKRLGYNLPPSIQQGKAKAPNKTKKAFS